MELIDQVFKQIEPVFQAIQPYLISLIEFLKEFNLAHAIWIQLTSFVGMILIVLKTIAQGAKYLDETLEVLHKWGIIKLKKHDK